MFKETKNKKYEHIRYSKKNQANLSRKKKMELPEMTYIINEIKTYWSD